jgi:hypothetical protein
VPWRPADATRLLFVNVVGGAVLVGGYVGTSETARLSHQLTWLSAAVVGFAIAGAGNVLWLLAGRRAVGLRLRALLAGCDPSAFPLPSADGSGAVTAAEQREVEGLVAVAQGTRYHRPGCLLVRGKPLIAHLPAGRRGPGRQPCEACRPELMA